MDAGARPVSSESQRLRFEWRSSLQQTMKQQMKMKMKMEMEAVMCG